MESDSPNSSKRKSKIWQKGEPILLKKDGLFFRKGARLELDVGNILIPLDEPNKRSKKKIFNCDCYVWSFLLADGSIAEFFFATSSYIFMNEGPTSKKIDADLQLYFESRK